MIRYHGKGRVLARLGRVGAMPRSPWISDRDEKELTRWKKVWRERAVWV